MACRPAVEAAIPSLGLPLGRVLGMAWALAFLALPAWSQTRSLAGEAAVSSDLIDRGMRIGPRGPMLQGGLTLTDTAGWSLGLAGSAELRSGRVIHAVARASRYEALTNDWQSQASLLYYAYPGYAPLRRYDRVEAGLGWTYRDVLALGVSAIYLLDGHDRRVQWAADLNLRWPLGEQFSLAAGIGQTDFAPAAVSRYTYGHAGLVWRFDAWRAEFNRQASDRRFRRAVGNPPPHWSATISRSF